MRDRERKIGGERQRKEDRWRETETDRQTDRQTEREEKVIESDAYKEKVKNSYKNISTKSWGFADRIIACQYFVLLGVCMCVCV